MIFFPDMDLVISGKATDEGKYLMFGACIDDLIDEGCWEVVFGTLPIEVAKVCANVNVTLFFIYRNKIKNPSGVCNGVDETACVQFLNFTFDYSSFGRMDGPLFLPYWGLIGPCVNVVFHNGWI